MRERHLDLDRRLNKPQISLDCVVVPVIERVRYVQERGEVESYIDLQLS